MTARRKRCRALGRIWSALQFRGAGWRAAWPGAERGGGRTPSAVTPGPQPWGGGQSGAGEGKEQGATKGGVWQNALVVVDAASLTGVKESGQDWGLHDWQVDDVIGGEGTGGNRKDAHVLVH